MPRVAALQFATGTSVEENLRTCLRMIDKAAVRGARLLVLPEFCNHISWYRNREHAWQCALELQGGFLQAIAERARRHSCHILINVSLRRSEPEITVTSLLYGPAGSLLGQADKQSLMGHENDFFTPAERAAPLVETELGKIGFIACRDGISFEPARRLALAGADLLCNSLNSFAFDEASLHVRARAAENQLFMVAANKVGPLVPAAELEMVSELTAIPAALLYGAGESQVVAPNGRPLARAPRGEEAVLIADIPVSSARVERLDGALARRRPRLYAPLAGNCEDARVDAAEEILVALVCPAGDGERALERAESLLRDLPVDTSLALLPALQESPQPEEDPSAAIEFGRKLEGRLLRICRERHLQICTSIVVAGDGGWHRLGLVLDGSGRLLAQPELHDPTREPVPAGVGLVTCDLSWGRVAVLVGADSEHPELARMAALAGAHCLLVTGGRNNSSPWAVDRQLLLSARAAENRLCLAACSGSNEGGMIASLEREFTLMTPWRERRFDGNINRPLVTPQQGEVTLAALHPCAAANKMISANTHLLRSRPLQSCAALLRGGTGSELCER